ncbi:SusE domain-containing protein [Lutibacter sp.]|uniref:SusE domain-containing protein n=1 Tax=Lutibacter sp. TaxID=1925666 RepID=UPI001A1D0B0B|nr:SusE domain-containing protein [Lutibacter sp.]MBI9039909.1 hypothetical protein [Lutibacter sp.]
MKNIFLVVAIVILIISCGGGDDSPPTSIPDENKAPSTPSLSNPINNSLCVDKVVTFEWGTSTDLDNDTIKYEIQIAKDNSFSQIVQIINTTSTSALVTLENNNAYYWRVKAIDSKNLAGNFSPIYKFFTYGIGVGNYAPFAPELKKPTLNSVIQSSTVELEWNASDVDSADILTYDVFLDTTNPPIVKVGDNLSAKTLTKAVNTSSTYYWKVVVKDNKGGQIIGQVWNFTTD